MGFLGNTSITREQEEVTEEKLLLGESDYRIIAFGVLTPKLHLHHQIS